ncbi:MAG: type II toxin-antitoxin system HicB family antitoxin [Chloroflexi bacterium]|nr:type II toxin-antitoxin system HicB family antitoxin [Chloroflexota bacterium]
MTDYALYVESGPKRRKTQVHVLDLLGCIAQGATTEEALENTPDAIRAYLRFLKKHGDKVDPEAEFTTSIAVHVMEGQWLGQGDPYPGFASDFETLSVEDLRTYRQRLSWMADDIVELVSGLSEEQLTHKPEKGRPIRKIAEHFTVADYAYLQGPLSKPKGMAALVRAVEESPASGLPAALVQFWELFDSRLEAITDEEREQHTPHGQKIWTARRALRRMLEHRWEHFSEISRRFE